MLVSGLHGLFLGDDGFIPLVFSALLTALVGLFPVIFVPRSRYLNDREGHVIVLFSWLSISVFGMLPYLFYGGPFHVASAWFESVSGFTTTGATILDDVESLPRSLLLWRSLTHWLGGIGVVVFMLVLLPDRGSARMVLSRSEVSSMARRDFHWRSSMLLWVMTSAYVGMTFLEFILLYASGIPGFDALNLAFSTIATGGFAVRNASVAAFGNFSAEVLISVFMFLASVHFGLVYGLALGRLRAFFRAPVVRFFLLAVASFSVVIALGEVSLYGSFLRSLHNAIFVVLSHLSTTGFTLVETQVWSSSSHYLLLMTFFMGGCAGSTAGGVKLDRIQIMFASFRSYLRGLVHPDAVVSTRVGDYYVSSAEVRNVFYFVLIYVTFVIVGGVVVSLHGFELFTSMSLSATCMGNAGPLVGIMSSFSSLSFLPVTLQLFLPLLMFLGRLEIFGVLILFSRSSWR